MKKVRRVLAIVLCVGILGALTGCGFMATNTQIDVENTLEVAADMALRQPTPTDIDYSLERYNLIKRAYWVNGQREKANTLPCAISRPLGYIVLLSSNGSIVGKFTVDGKVSSLNSYLTPDSEYYEIATSNSCTRYNEWLADVDGSYGTNDSGIFFFDTNGNYIEWTGDYLYTDIPMAIEDPVIRFGYEDEEVTVGTTVE